MRRKNLENVDSAVICMLDEIGIFNYTSEILVIDNWISFFEPGVTNTKFFDDYQEGVYLCEEKVNMEYGDKYPPARLRFLREFYMCMNEYAPLLSKAMDCDQDRRPTMITESTLGLVREIPRTLKILP